MRTRKIASIVPRLTREQEFNHLAKKQKEDENKISELEETINHLRKELHDKQKETDVFKSTFQEKLSKQANDKVKHKQLECENSELKKTVESKMRIIKHLEDINMLEILKQQDANKYQKLEILELKEKLESKIGVIKKLEEKNKVLSTSNTVKNNTAIENVSLINSDTCTTLNSKKAQETEQQKQAKKKKYHRYGVTPSLKLKYGKNEGAPFGVKLSNRFQTITAISGHGYRYVTTSQPLSQYYASVWKVTIEQLIGCISIGLIGDLEPSVFSYHDKTCYSWDNYGTWIGHLTKTHNSKYGGWNDGFISGDVVFFRYEPESKILTMKGKRQGKDQAFVLQCNRLANAYIHINIFWKGDRITLEEMTHYEKKLYFHSQ